MPLPEKSNETKALLAHLEKFGKDRSWAELNKMFNPKGESNEWARNAYKKHFVSKGKAIKTKAETNPLDKVHETRTNLEKTHLRNQSSALAKRIIELENDLQLAFRIKNTPIQAFAVKAITGKKNEGTAICQWSDWHVDEVVKKEVVNGLNEYNPEIAKQRAAKLFENTIKLINTQRSSIDIHTLVVQLGGDFIGGYIHPELQQTNSMSPIEGIFFARNLLASGIEFIKKQGQFKKIIFVCNRGNHGRLTPKMQFNNDYSMNLETMLFRSLAESYQNESVSFVIEESDCSYLSVYDRTLRFFHGHQVKSLGGIGGLTIPLYKQLHRWNDTMPAYYNFMCDKHVYSNPTPDCQVNSSLKGFDSYAASRGFKYQDAMQSFTLLDSKRGVTIKAPVFCQ